MILNFLNTSFPPWYPGLMAMLISPGYLLFQGLVLFSVFYGFRNFKKLSSAYKSLIFYLLIVSIVEIISKIFIELGRSNHLVYHSFIPIQSVFYGLIFSYLLTGKKMKLPFYIGVFYAIVSIGTSWLSIDSKISFPSLNISFLSAIMVAGSLLLYYQLIQKPSETSLFKQSDFWFATGNLIFFAGSFLIFGLYDWILGQEGQHIPPWVGQVIFTLNYLLYGSYLVSIYLDARKASKLPFK